MLYDHPITIHSPSIQMEETMKETRHPTPSVRFFPAGAGCVRFELRLSEHFVLVGEYVNGVLRGITLHGPGRAAARPGMEK